MNENIWSVLIKICSVLVFVLAGYLIGISEYKVKLEKRINQYNDLLIRYGTLQNNYNDLHSECFMVVGEDS